MTGRLLDWLDHRTGYRKALEVLLIEHIPGGAKWRYVWGSTLVFVFSVQLITGLLLMTAYSPGDSTAWLSVWYIQYQMDFGWLIRGLHHFGSQTMVVLLGLHMLQVVIAGAHLPPREINWWLGLMLLGAVLGLSLTGYLLPWDQKGFWATQVATNIASNVPVLGPEIQKIVVGGPSYGHATLTRFFALHVGILPPLMIVLIIAHMLVFRRHGVTVPLVTVPTDEEGEPIHAPGDSWFWPDQAFRDMVACMVTFAVMLSLALYGHGHAIDSPSETTVSPETAEATEAAPPSMWQRWAHAGRAGKGANLDAPADPGTDQYPARPEWYFLFLFQLLKYFKGTDELIGTVVIPGGVGALLAILPLLGFGPMRKFGHVVGVLVVSAILLSAALLTYMAIADDHAPFYTTPQLDALAEKRDPELTTEQQDDIKLLKQTPSKTARFEKALDFQVNVRKAEKAARRAVQLADAGIPADGPIQLLRRDPETRGRELFKNNCATCHTYGTELKASQPKASDLKDFGTEDWIRGLLTDPGQAKYFGRTNLEDMSGWSGDNRDKGDDVPTKAKDADLDQIAAWLAGHPTGGAPVPAFQKFCIRCHSFAGKGGTTTGSLGPDFTGYGSPAWVHLMITAPDHPTRYGRGIRNAMPAFRSDIEGPLGKVAKQDYATIINYDPKFKKEADKINFQPLSDLDRELIVRFLFNDPRAVFGGNPVADQPRR